MLLTITTTHGPATDLGYVLHKNPAKVQDFSLSFGRGIVFYPEAGEERCTAALLLDVDPVGLVRPRGRGSVALDQYVNDRPYAASSFLSVAIAQVYASALKGTSRERPELAEMKIPLEARVSAVPAGGDGLLIRELFEPLGYQVEISGGPLDEKFPEWGNARTWSVRLAATTTVRELLTHLYVLIPVLDNDKHYWVGDDEVDKLLRFGEGWLAGHPKRELIVQRYLKYFSHLSREALSRLAEEDLPDPDAAAEAHSAQEQAIERPLSLNQQRIGSVVAALRSLGARRVVDLGCGEGTLIRELLRDPRFEQVTGVDVSMRALQMAADRLELDRMPERQRARVQLVQGSLMYRDSRLEEAPGFDAATLVEVIEHLDPPRLAAMERVVFEFLKPAAVVVTTPNAEYNVKWEALPAGKFRHADHRFEWTREEFRTWAEGVAGRFGYAVKFLAVGSEDAGVGPPTQMAVLSRRGAGGAE